MTKIKMTKINSQQAEELINQQLKNYRWRSNNLDNEIEVYYGQELIQKFYASFPGYFIVDSLGEVIRWEGKHILETNQVELDTSTEEYQRLYNQFILPKYTEDGFEETVLIKP
jgi:hypothetical protein